MTIDFTDRELIGYVACDTAMRAGFQLLVDDEEVTDEEEEE